MGPVSDTVRNALLATSDVFVAPNTGQESFGIVILEALASGAQVVASDLPAFAAVLRDDTGLVGRLARPGDADAVARSVIAALADAGDPVRGRRLAARFDWSTIGPAVVDCYREAIAGRRVPTATPRVPVASRSRLAPGSRL